MKGSENIEKISSETLPKVREDYYSKRIASNVVRKSPWLPKNAVIVGLNSQSGKIAELLIAGYRGQFLRITGSNELTHIVAQMAGT